MDFIFYGKPIGFKNSLEEKKIGIWKDLEGVIKLIRILVNKKNIKIHALEEY